QCFEHRAVVGKDRRVLGHPEHDFRMLVDGDADDRPVKKEVVGGKPRDDVLHGQLELLNRKVARCVQADERSAATNELLERGEVSRGQSVRVLWTDGTAATSTSHLPCARRRSI